MKYTGCTHRTRRRCLRRRRASLALIDQQLLRTYGYANRVTNGISEVTSHLEQQPLTNLEITAYTLRWRKQVGATAPGHAVDR